MKKTMKKLFTLLVAVFIVLPAVSCVGGDDGNKPGPEGRINLIIEEAGLGSQWLDKLASAYFAKTGVRVTVARSYIKGEIPTLLADGSLVYDIAFPIGGLGIYSAQETNKLVDLSAVYDAVPEGSDEKIKDMTNQSVYNHLLADDGKIYRMSWYDTVGGLIYNKTSLDEAFGVGEYTIPRTTNELIAFSDNIKDNTDLYPLAFCPSIPYSYMAHLVWWAQYEGYDNYYDFYAGYYNDGTERKLAENAEVFDMPGRAKSLEPAATLLKKSNKYVPETASSMTYMEYQAAFLGHGYKGADMKKYAMTFNGSWLENEMADYLDVIPQDYRMVRMPVISSITEKLEDTSMSDTTLRDLVSAIDEGLESFGTVSENDFKRVKDARLMVNSLTLEHIACIPSRSTNQDKAKDFLIWMTSEEAQEIYSNELNGITMPYGYQPDEDSMSSFIKSCHESFGRDYILVGEDNSSPLVYSQALGPYYGSVDNLLFRGDSISSILSTTKNYYKTYWDKIIAMAK